MARIRTIKPEFWVDDVMVELPFEARLLYIGLWNFVDDEGYIEDKPKRIKMMIFPADDVLIEDSLSALCDAGRLHSFDSDQGPILRVANWQRHQRINRPTATRFTGITAKDRRSSVSPHPPITEPSVGKGKEGKGRDQIHAHPPGARMDELFNSFWSVWPLKKGKQPARKAFEKAIKSGASLEQILAGVENYKREIGPSPDWSKVKYPQGWLNDARWEDETAPVVKPSNQPDPYRSSAPTCAEGAHRWLGDGTCMLCTERRP